jgi:hypothetical protein
MDTYARRQPQLMAYNGLSLPNQAYHPSQTRFYSKTGIEVAR